MDMIKFSHSISLSVIRLPVSKIGYNPILAIDTRPNDGKFIETR